MMTIHVSGKLMVDYATWYLEHLDQCSICDPIKIFFTSKFSNLLSWNPTHETKTMITNSWGTTNNKPPRAIIMMV